MAIPASALRSNKERADGHAFNRQVSIDEAKRTAAWIFKTVNELPWQQKAVFLTVAIGLVAGGVGFVQHNNIGGAKDNFKAWANAFNLTDGGDSPVIVAPTPEHRPQVIPPAGDMSTPTTVKSTETSTLAPTATQEATATPAPTATSTPRPTNTQAPTAEKPQPTATPKPDNPRLPGTPDGMPNGSYPTNNEKTDWSTPPMANNPCEGLPDKFWFPPRTIKYDPNKNLPWGEVRYVCTYNTEYKGYVAGGKLIYDKKP